MLAFRGGLNPSARLNDDLTQIQAHEAPGVFCRETLTLGAGPHTVRLQILLPKTADRQVLVLTAATGAGEVLARATLDTAAPDALDQADAVTLGFVLEAPATVAIEGTATSHARLTHLRFLTAGPVAAYEGNEALFRFFPAFDLETMLPKTVVFGTTAVCNANCFHCPTNKAYSKTQAKGFMTLELFERIVGELADMGFKGGVLFGLFGDPLSDPLFLERMKIVKRLLPDSLICPSTNAGQYESDKHREAMSLADDVAVHVEGVTAEVYNFSMKPLKIARSVPRVERLIEDRQGRTMHVISPVHRKNLHEMAALRDAWEDKGAGNTVFAYLMNRGGKADAFDDVALAPTATGCGPDIMTDLVIDWDGAVVTCCQDFHRRTIIGDLTRETVREVMTNAARRRTVELLNDKRWNAIETCAGCKNDCEASVQTLVSERLKDSDGHRVFTPREFQARGPVETQPDVFWVRSRRGAADWLRAPFAKAPRATVFGPYKPLYPGRYRLTFDVAEVRAEPGARLALEIVTPAGRMAVHRFRGAEARRPPSVEIDVTDYTPLEFRIRAQGLDFEFRGVSSVRLDG